MHPDNNRSLMNLIATIVLAVVSLVGILFGIWMTRGSQAAGTQSATGTNGLVVGGGLTLGLIILILSIIAFVVFVVLTIVQLLKNGKDVVEAITPEKSDKTDSEQTGNQKNPQSPF